MIELPGRKEFIEYAEGATVEPEVQERILQLLASSALVRENLSELKRDLYRVDVLIPDFQPDANFRLEVAKVIPVWLKKGDRRRFPFFPLWLEAVMILLGFLSFGVLAVYFFQRH